MITIAERIEVHSPVSTVWSVLADPESVISCIGGATMGERHQDGSFDAALSVKFGGLRVAFNATATLELEEDERVGYLAARGSDRQGATRASAETRFRVQEGSHPAHSLVTIDGEVNLSGKLTSIIEAGAGVVVARMTREFGNALGARCEPEIHEREAVASTGAAAIRVAPKRRGILALLRGWLRRSARISKRAGAEPAVSPESQLPLGKSTR
jgi:uncharacterized protein